MNKQGQSIIEYVLIAILVILGIVLMGGYVLRSVNAHYKLWDEGVQDSFTENLRQAPLNDIPPISSNCQCTATPENCGSSQSGVTLCGPSQREIDTICNIPGCNLGNPTVGNAIGNAAMAQSATCEYDTGCCSRAMSSGCGYSPIGAGANVGISTACPNDQDGNPISSGCLTALPTPANPSPCTYGQETYGFQCGSSGSQVCVPDATHCPPPECTGSGSIIYPGSAIFCATGTSTAPTTGLTRDTPISYVAGPGSCSTAASPCVAYCTPPYFLNDQGTGCTKDEGPSTCATLIPPPPPPLSNTLYCFDSQGNIFNTASTTFPRGDPTAGCNLNWHINVDCRQMTHVVPVVIPPKWLMTVVGGKKTKDVIASQDTQTDINNCTNSGGPLDNDNSCPGCANAFCQQIGYAGGVDMDVSSSDECGRVSRWDASTQAWKRVDEGAGGNRKFADVIKCCSTGVNTTGTDCT